MSPELVSCRDCQNYPGGDSVCLAGHRHACAALRHCPAFEKRQPASPRVPGHAFVTQESRGRFARVIEFVKPRPS